MLRRLNGLRRAWHDSAAGRFWRHGAEVELMHRALGFAALCLVTLVPWLIVVAAIDPFSHRGFGEWVVDGMGLSGHPAAAVRDLFSAPRKVVSTTSVYSIVALALFGVSLAGSVQTGYERVWALSVGRWHRLWQQAVWLAGLTAYLFAEVESGAWLPPGAGRTAVRVLLTLVAGAVFFWWGQYLLLGARVPARPLLPGALATMAGLVGLRFFSTLVFSPLIVSNAVAYGSVGTVLVVESWLIGVGFVIHGGCLLGRHVYAYGLSRAAAEAGEAAPELAPGAGERGEPGASVADPPSAPPSAVPGESVAAPAPTTEGPPARRPGRRRPGA
jgi:membrane protein